MIDFIANITNKKNMTMGNMKTLMATSVLCVFFNGILIYGMKEEKDTQEQEIKEKLFDIEDSEKKILNNDNINNENKDIYLKKQEKTKKKEKEKVKKYNINNTNPEIKNSNDVELLNSQQNNENSSETNKTIEKEKKISDNILFNYKGHVSLLCCCNLWNDKEENMKKYNYEQLKKEEEKNKDNDLFSEERNNENDVNLESSTQNNLENNTKNKIKLDINNSTEIKLNNNNNNDNNN